MLDNGIDFMQIQRSLNELTQQQIDILKDSIVKLLDIVSDQEKDMIKMAKKINELEAKIQQKD